MEVVKQFEVEISILNKSPLRELDNDVSDDKDVVNTKIATKTTYLQK